MTTKTKLKYEPPGEDHVYVGEVELDGLVIESAYLLDTGSYFDENTGVTHRNPTAKWDLVQLTSKQREIEATRALTDMGNGERLADLFDGYVHYVPEWKAWAVWDGTRYRKDLAFQINECAKVTVRSIALEAERARAAGDNGLWAALLKFEIDCESAGSVNAMIKMALSDERLVLNLPNMDADPHVLNCANGTVDLRTGELRPHSQADKITATTGINYNPDATCPEWEEFIAWAMPDDPEMAPFLQRALGYSLDGNTAERVVVFLYGRGKNGKSTLLKTVRNIARDYGKRIPSNTFEKGRGGFGGDSASPSVAQFKGLRFTYTSEMASDATWNEGLLKDITGDEPMSGRMLYGNPFEFMPTNMVWVAANHRPKADAEDEAIWDRMLLVPFNSRVVGEPDKDLGHRFIRDEAEGILRWLVDGAVDYWANGLQVPQSVRDATYDYRSAMDTFTDFIEWVEEYETELVGTRKYPNDPKSTFVYPPIDYSPDPLRKFHNDWAVSEGLDILTRQEFGNKLHQRNWAQTKIKGKRTWVAPEVKTRTNYSLANLAAYAESTGYAETDTPLAEQDRLGAEVRNRNGQKVKR